MAYRKDLGPNSFVLAFDVGTDITTTLTEIYNAVTEFVGGVPRYGYEPVGFYTTKDARNLGTYRCFLMRGKTVDGTTKFVTFTFNLANGVFSIETGTAWSDADGQLRMVARYHYSELNVMPMHVIPAGRFQVFVFAHRDWLVVVPQSFDTMNTAKITGGLCTFNVIDPSNVNPKYILSHTACLSGVAEYKNGYDYGSIAKFSPFQYAVPRSIINPGGTYTDEGFGQEDTLLITQFGALYPTKKSGGAANVWNEADYLSWCPGPEANVAATLRGRIGFDKTKVNNAFSPEFKVCGIKMSTPKSANFMDKVSVKCDSNYLLNTETGTDVDHYVLAGSCLISIERPGKYEYVFTQGPVFNYLIPA